MPRASAPPEADAQSSGKTLNMPNKNAAPQASRRSATLGVARHQPSRLARVTITSHAPAGQLKVALEQAHLKYG